MAKSKAQRMREYRQRKKEKLGDKWLKQERDRVKGYFKPMSTLDERQKIEKRDKNRIRQGKFRSKKISEQRTKDKNASRSIIQNSEESQVIAASTSDNTISSRSLSNTTLTIKLPFPTSSSRSSASKKRASRALAKSYRRIETLEDKNEELQKKLKTAQRRLQRFEAKQIANTPKSKTDKLLKQAGFNPAHVPEIRKKLVFGECLSAEIKSAKVAQENSCEKTGVVHRIASGRIIRKYRLKATLEKMTNLNRRKSCLNKSVMPKRKVRLGEHRQQIENEIVNFLERDDNSRQMPGKADAVKSVNSKVQKRVLNDYMYNLHLKFIAESPLKISRASFYRARPKHLVLVNFASRSVCLCSKHQKFCFLLRSLKRMNITTCTNPDKFVEMYKLVPDSLQNLLSKVPDNGEDIRFQQWKRVKLNNGKERQRVVEIQKGRTEFIDMMIEAFQEFKAHIERVKQQYSAVKTMKDKLPTNHALIQMDFSENYSCNTFEEIQSAYWNNCMITLHPVVIYYRNTNNELKHISYVYVSEVLNHNAAMVISIIGKVMQVVRELVSSLRCVHFWTDSPSSQYRNKSIFDLVSRFPQKYGSLASWHFFETGHGKGPCDGIGGTTKRNADNAVKQGKVLIQDATDFYKWAKENEHGIHYSLVTEEEYIQSKDDVEQRNTEIKPVKGSMVIHAAVGIDNGKVVFKNSSCACEECFNGGFNVKSSCGWEERSIATKTNQKDKVKDQEVHTDIHKSVKLADKVDAHADENEDDRGLSTENKTEKEKEVSERKIQELETWILKFVIAKYDGNCYVGKLMEVCRMDNTARVNFMSKCGKLQPGHFKWPTVEDEILVEVDDIVKMVGEPIPTSKTGRLFVFPEDTLQYIS